MAQQHIDVMISSTRKDLEQHRIKVEDAILRLSMFPVGMERMAAADSDAIAESLRMVDISEVYLGIFGMRYGFIPDDPRNPDKISITEMEYRRAVERDIPILIFMMDKTHPLTAEDVETEPEKQAKLNALKEEMLEKYIVADFTSPENLGYLAIQSLQRVKDKAAERIGENDPESLEVKEDLIVPPDLLALPRYTLTANFIGRRRELALLDSWSQADKPMMIVEAIGGMGKSALTWEWVNREAQEEAYEGRFWYSFYEGGTNMQSFLRDAVAYFKEVPSKELKLNRGELERELMNILDTKRVLLVLDGLERVLVAYHRFDAAHIRDDQVDEKERQRKATDPKDGRFLKQLAMVKQGKVLLSSRLMPLSLEDAKGVSYEKLEGLDPDDAYDLMLDRGVKEPQNRKQMDTFMAQFGYHGLLLTITAGRIKSFTPAPGSFDSWYQVFGRDLRDPDIKEARKKLLKYAFEGLDETAQKFLSQIAAFQDAIPYETLAVFNPYGKQAPKVVKEPPIWDSDEQKEAYKAYLQEKEAYEQYSTTQEYFDSIASFHNLLTDLTDRGLLQWERGKNSYDLHPVVRGYSFEQLDKGEREATYNKIHNHFENRPVNYDEATNVHDIYNAIMVYRALVGAGRLEDAARFYWGVFSETLFYTLNSNHLIMELLQPLFTKGLDTFPPIDDRLKGYIASDLAAVFYRAGQVTQALLLERLLVKEGATNKYSDKLPTRLLNHADSLASNNQIALAIRNYELALQLSQLDGNDFKISLSHALLLRYTSLIGNWQEADTHYNQIQFSLISWSDVYKAERLFYRALDATQELGTAWQSIKSNRQFQHSTRVWAMSSRNHLRLGRVDEALSAIDEAINWANRQGRAELASYLATRGLIWSHLDKMDDAQKDINTATEINLFPREFAHIYNCASRVYQKSGNPEKAKDYALEAYTYAWADGEPYVRWYDLQEAKKQLDALGIDHPKLKPYDTDNPEKVYMEDEILALIEELKAKKTAEEAEKEDHDPFGEES